MTSRQFDLTEGLGMTGCLLSMLFILWIILQ